MNKRRILTIALCASVFANLMLIGYILGRETRTMSPELSMDPSYGFPRLLRALPQERMSELMSSIHDHRSNLWEEYREVYRAQRAMYEDFLAEPFVLDNLRDSSAVYGDSLCTARASTDTVFLHIVDQLTHEERKLLLDSARREWRRVNRDSRERRASDQQVEQEVENK